MFEYEDMFFEDAELEIEEEGCIDPTDEMSIIEAMVDAKIAEEACKKEASKKEVCEKCGKPKKECTCK